MPLATLADERMEAGHYRLQWHGVDDAGSTVASGIYFYRLQAGGQVATRKMMLLR